MAPRGCSKKRNTRMAAALDAMGLLGFSENFVMKTLKELLKVYGEDNWLFIEQDSYKVLIESILEKQELQRDDTAPDPSSNAVGSSNTTTEALTTAQIIEGLESEAQGNGASDAPMLPGGDDVPLLAPIPPVSREETNCEDFEKETNTVKNHINDDAETDNMYPQSVLIGNSHLSSPHRIPSPQPKESIPNRRRPCHGWISDEDEDEDGDPNLVELIPAPLPKGLARLVRRIDVRCGKRKSMWDVRPEHM